MPEALAVLNTCYMSKVIVHNGQCVYPHALEQNIVDYITKLGEITGCRIDSSQAFLPIYHSMVQCIEMVTLTEN